MNNKYSYAEGGFLDDGAEVDPISGTIHWFRKTYADA